MWLTRTKLKTFNSTQSTGKNKSKYFITRTTYLSVELNANNLLHLILLVQQKQLPQQVLHIHTFSSQACESIFRNTRALSGIYSTIVNFTVHDFLRRAQRLSLLNDIKCKQLNDESINKIAFPIYFKHRHDLQSLVIPSQAEIDQIDLEQITIEAYDKVVDMLSSLQILNLLKDNSVLSLEILSKYVLNYLNSNSKMYDYSSQLINMNDEEFEIADDDDDDNEDDETTTNFHIDDGNDDDNEDDETTTDFHIDDGNNDDLSSDNDCSDGDEQDDDRNLIDTTK